MNRWVMVLAGVLFVGLIQAQAESLWDILKNGTPKDHPKGRFTHDSAPLFCCIDLSDYLHRFGGDVVQVPRKYAWPRSLSKVLYTQRPRRVVLFRRNEPRVGMAVWLF